MEVADEEPIVRTPAILVVGAEGALTNLVERPDASNAAMDENWQCCFKQLFTDSFPSNKKKTPSSKRSSSFSCIL